MVILICMCYWHAISGGMIYQMFPKAGSVAATTTTTAIPTFSSFQTSVEDELSGDTALTTLQSDIGDQGSITSTAAPNKTTKCPTVAAAASTKPGPDAIKIDKVALGIFAGIYSSFNMYFLVKVIIGYCKVSRVQDIIKLSSRRFLLKFDRIYSHIATCTVTRLYMSLLYSSSSY